MPARAGRNPKSVRRPVSGFEVTCLFLRAPSGTLMRGTMALKLISGKLQE
jgi:hypothetical protein